MRAALVLVMLCLAGCGGHDRHGVMRIVQRATEANSNGGVSSTALLDGVRRVKVEGYAGTPEFHVAERTSAMEKFPCMKCHQKPLEQLRKAQEGKKAAHWEVKLEHSSEQVMGCATCHLTEDLNSLATLNKKKVEMNHAYAVCAQCHSRQASDWASGAHGKRLGGWAPPRVVQGCPGCHNPHRPKMTPRLPVLAEKRGMR